MFGSNTSHTTVINNLGSDSSNRQSREDKKKDSEDSRKLLALGIAAVVVCIAFHVGMCFWYNNSRKNAKKSEKIDYLDSQLKIFRDIEFTVSAISLVALVCCAVNPVLPAWGLVVLGINSLACFAGGLAFHMKHGKESENIEKAKEAVADYHKRGPGHNFGDSSHREAPPAYSYQDPNTVPTAPPKSDLNNSYQEQHFGAYEQQSTY